MEFKAPEISTINKPKGTRGDIELALASILGRPSLPETPICEGLCNDFLDAETPFIPKH